MTVFKIVWGIFLAKETKSALKSRIVCLFLLWQRL